MIDAAAPNVGQLSDVSKALLASALALTTLFIWELWIKPLRTRRNLALVLIAEMELNLEEIAYYQICRDEDPENQLVNMMLSRTSFGALQASVAELTPGDLRDVIQFYSLTSKIESTEKALTETDAKLAAAAEPEQKKVLSDAVASGVRTTGHLLEEAWTVGNRARASLHRFADDLSLNGLPALVASEAIHAAARERRKHRA